MCRCMQESTVSKGNACLLWHAPRAPDQHIWLVAEGGVCRQGLVALDHVQQPLHGICMMVPLYCTHLPPSASPHSPRVSAMP